MSKAKIYSVLTFVLFGFFFIEYSNAQCTISCIQDTTFYTDPDSTATIIDSIIPATSGTCIGNLLYSLSGATTGTGDTIINDTFNLGLTYVSYSIDEDTCRFNVLVADLQPPLLSDYDDILTTANPNDCGAQVNYDPPSISDNTEDIENIEQIFNLNFESIEELSDIGWEFINTSLFNDTCLYTNELSTSEKYTVTTSYFKFENNDSIFFTHWASDPVPANNDSLIVYLVNNTNDTLRIYEHACINEETYIDTIQLNATGFYRVLFAYKTETGSTVRGYIDDIFIQAPYAHHTDDNNNDIPVNPLQVFQLDSSYVTGDIFPAGETKIIFKAIDYFGNYSLAEFTITVAGGKNIISGETEAEENTIQLYTTSSEMINYNWTVSGGTEYDGNGKDSIYIFWDDPPTGTLDVEYDDTSGGATTHVTSCTYAVNINNINYGCFQYKRKLTINSALVEGDLADFPVLVYDTLPEFKHTSYGGHIAHYNGYDISFSTDSNGIDILPHQLDYFNPSQGIIGVWIMFDSLYNNADTDFYIHYGNANINRDISSDTIWSEDWVGIYHLGNNLKDYGRNSNTATNKGTEITDGAIGLGRSFERDDDDYIILSNPTQFSFTTSMTVSFWVYVESFPTAYDSGCEPANWCDNDWMDIIIKGDNKNWRFVANRDYDNLYYAFNYGNENYDTDSPNGTFNEVSEGGGWYYVTGTWESFDDGIQSNNLKKLFINGDSTIQNYWNTPNNSIDDDSDFKADDPVIFGINNDAENTRSLDGILDEVRLSNEYKPNKWIITDYNTQSNPENFISFGEEQPGTIVSSIGGEASITEDKIYAREFVTGSLTGYSGTIQWQLSSDKANFTDIEGATNENLMSKPLLEDSYFRALVSNRGCAKSSTIDSVNVIAGFIDCEYNYRFELVIDPDSIPGTDDLENFPFLIEMQRNELMDTAHGGDVMNSNGWDIVFTNENGISIIPHEVDIYDPETGLYRAWVKIPKLHATDTTYLYIYYGKAGITENPSNRSVWGNEYIGVWHLNNNYRDTANTNHGTATNSPSHTTGIIGNGVDFTTANYLTIANESNFDIPANGEFSISCWIKIDNFNASDEPLITKGTTAWELRRDGSTSNGEFLVDLNSGESYIATGNTAINSGWKHITASFDHTAEQYVLYVNGSLTSTSNDVEDADLNSNNTQVIFGAFDGMLDEVRVTSIYRSEDWVNTEYRNQKNPDGFLLVREPRQLCSADPDGGSIFSDDTVVCIGRNAVIELHNSDGNIYWQESEDSIEWDFILGETDTILETETLTDTMYYRAVVSEECCSDYSPVIRINYKNTDPPDVHIYVNNIACAGSDNGIINIDPQPSSYDYSYLWSNDSTTEDIYNLAPGNYSVTIVDNDSDCNLKENRTVLESERIIITLAEQEDVTCSGSDGAINIAVAGGTLPDLLFFDTTHYARIGDNDSLDNSISSEGSIEARFKTIDTTRQGTILFKGDNGTDSSYSLVLNNNTILFNFRHTGSGTYTVSWDSVEINRWYHAAIDWDGSNIRLYINGKQKDITAMANGMNNTTDSLYIGKKGITPSSTRDYFYGYIRDVRIWDRTRLQTSIEDSMKIPLVGSENGLLAYWPMDDSGEDTLFNKSNNENIHGEIVPASGISWIDSEYEYSWSNDSIDQDISSLDTGTYYITVSDIYGCFEERDFYIDFDENAKTPPTPPVVSMEGNRYGKGPVVLKVFGPNNNCPDSAVRYIWYTEDVSGGQSVTGKTDSLFATFQNSSQTYYVASVNFSGTESETRTAAQANINTLDSNYRSLSLPDQNDFITIKPHETYQPTDEISVMVWFLISDLDNGATIIENGWDNSNGIRLYYNGTSSTLRFEVNSDVNYVETIIEEDKWQHIAATYNKNQIKIYLNGLLIDSANYSDDVTYSIDSVVIGNQFTGYIDDIYIWDTTLNQYHIKSLMYQVIEPNCFDDNIYMGLDMKNLKLYCNFNYYSTSGNTIITGNYLYPGNIRNNASLSNQVPFDNWFPNTDDNWHTLTNWYSGDLPTAINPGFAVINSDTAKLNGTDAECYGLVLKKDALITAANNGTNKLAISGDIYNADLILNAYEVDTVEVYSSISLKEQETIETYSIGNISSNVFQSSIAAKGLRSFYFNDDTLSALQFSAVDTLINFDWETNPPNSYITNDGDYSILWTGQIKGPISDDVTFYLTTEGTAELWVNDSLIISNIETITSETDSSIASMTLDEWSNLVIVFRNISNSGSIILEWQYTGQSRQVIPAEYLKPYNGIFYE